MNTLPPASREPLASSSLLSTPSGFSHPDLLCLSHLRWHFVTQRPQHLLSRAAEDRRVFFFEEPVFRHAEDGPAFHAGSSFNNHTITAGTATLEITQELPSLWVLRPHLVHGTDSVEAQRSLLQKFLAFAHSKRLVRWFYTPMALSFSDGVAAELTVYDCMDELSGFQGAPPELGNREQQLFSVADVVFTGGISLYEAKQRQHANVHAFPSSIEVAHFQQASSGSLAEPSDQAAIPHPRVGFYGVVDERFDVGLLRDVAALRPSMHFVILGPVVKIDEATLPRSENIHYLGGKKYGVLPAYLSGWDVAMLPFALNDSTRFISPTKTPEYLAAGRPVVSTPIRDVVRGYGDAGLVQIAANAHDFAAALDRALGLPSTSWQQAVADKLAQSSWDSTWAGMQREMERALASRHTYASHTGVEAGTRKAPATAAHAAAPHASLSAPSALANFRLRSMATPEPTTSRAHRTEHFDYVVVGAGFAGSVLAERLASQLDKRILLIDRRDHIAGNAYDFFNSSGILIHQYGPHIFHTNSDEVVNYLSKFTAWRPYEHRVLASIDGQLLPIPINLDTINRLYGLSLDAAGMKAFLASKTVTPVAIRTSEDIVISRVGRELYEKFFRNYTRKQWGLDPSELDSSVAGRIPVRYDRDDRYFADTFQAMPLHGYTHMFGNMLDHPMITVRTGVDYKEISNTYRDAKIIFTGPIDEYFGFRFGPLPYRSLEFKHETHDVEQFQAAPVINYPNDHAYTRVTEFKYLTGQKHARTSIVYEYPQSTGDPYYPIPRPENAAIFARYKSLAERTGNVHFCGRLANYKYFNMDQVVAQALSTFRSIAADHDLAVATTLNSADVSGNVREVA